MSGGVPCAHAPPPPFFRAPIGATRAAVPRQDSATHTAVRACVRVRARVPAEQVGVLIGAPCSPLASDGQQCWCPQRLNKATVRAHRRQPLAQLARPQVQAQRHALHLPVRELPAGRALGAVVHLFIREPASLTIAHKID
jgi:hypothetical protein